MLLNEYFKMANSIKACLKSQTKENYDKLLESAEFVKYSRADLKNPNVTLFKLTKVLCEIKLGMKYKVESIDKLIVGLKITRNNIALSAEPNKTLAYLAIVLKEISDLPDIPPVLEQHVISQLSAIIAISGSETFVSPLDKLKQLF